MRRSPSLPSSRAPNDPGERALPEFVRRSGEHAWCVEVWAQPGAKESQVVGVQAGRLKVRIAAPAVDNKANEALRAFVAKLLGLKVRQVTIKAGQTGRHKTLGVESDREPAWTGMAPVAERADQP